ncbi:MAG: ribosome small subunit-dependent GTPase A [Sulfobacillus thermosulfidooxidans]|uniref:ribosome small subunit-dependent GTPase A n=1 Tax=Sulfobacillus TaxID=28033 RepID=UPI000CD0C3E4|nr:ribosome small subunit-dependent GTPase A [Sulfobacillus sp. hq2]MCY0908511.1 ribosome small subunit-dependent GTPase A [Sulfobacillus thermotolerans]POB09227.1 ribosome small subunit-dependent GTPase A [Sulfobacillus sp. hq2]PSR37186.1 MAG: ribosome small subunit-dependent GTPase A [Sulfobacillus thermosulfidooxidans]
MQGLVVLLEANRPTVETEDGARYLCYLRGKIKRDHGRILVGDWVEIERTDPHEAIVTKVWPRRNQLVRPPIANVAGLFVVFSASQPKGSLELLDKRLVLAHMMGVAAEIVVTKTDLNDAEGRQHHVITLYQNIGYRVWPVSAVTGQGINALVSAKREGVWVLVGESGAGKSSLAKALLPHERIEVQELSRIGRGQQTTRWVRLLRTGTFWLADTPGYTALETTVKDAARIRDAFWEWDGARCRFASCYHLDEPGCAVLDGLQSGRFDLGRYAHYKVMLEQWVKPY